MTASFRLFAIETRRSVGLWFLPVLAGLGWLVSRSFGDGAGVTIWPLVSANIGRAMVVLMPAAGGLAAWVAGRDRRRGLEDLLKTTPAPASRRELTLLGATVVWVVLAYLGAGAYLVVQGVREATWGGPVAAPILLGGLAILTGAAIGHAVGSLVGGSIASRLTAALVPVGIFALILVPMQLQGEVEEVNEFGFGMSSYPLADLSPFAVIEDVGGSVFQSPDWALAASSVAWLLGLGGVAIAITMARRGPSVVGAGVLAVAVASAAVGAARLVPASELEVASPDRAIAYEPSCVQRSIPICLHPAYEAVLEETADLVDPIVRPLAGVPGAAVRAEQPRPSVEGVPVWFLGPTDPETIPISPVCDDVPAGRAVVAVALAAVQVPEDVRRRLTPPERLTSAQHAIAVWLLRQAGWEAPAEIEIAACIPNGGVSAMGWGIGADVTRAAERFGALPPEEQRAWLEANFAALRAGSLTLEDLP